MRFRASRRVCFPVLLFLCISCLGALAPDVERGNLAMADRYLSLSLDSIEKADFAGAEVILEKGSDFASASSDISYLLALVKAALGRPASDVLAFLQKARETGRWQRYSPSQAAIVEAGLCVRLRSFDKALLLLSPLSASEDKAFISLEALAGLSEKEAYLSLLATSLESWPTDIRFPRFLFTHADRDVPSPRERTLVDLELRRLSILLEVDPSLAILAAPFIRDTGEARRLVSAARSMGRGGDASIPVALSLGLIDEGTAISELFSPSRAISVGHLRAVWSLLRTDQARDVFSRVFLSFSGTLTEDADGDGWPEARASYVAGTLSSWIRDGDQDGIPEIELYCSGGLPFRASVDLPSFPSGREGSPASPPLKAVILWSRYPLVASVQTGVTSWYPSPAGFSWAPARLEYLVTPVPVSPLRFPSFDLTAGTLTERSLVSFSSAVERPGTLSKDSKLRIELLNGLPLRAVETLNGLVIGESAYRNGKLVTRHLDLDFDGRMETTDVFTPSPASPSWLEAEGTPSLRECDWDGDSRVEYAERLLPDGGIERSWDMDGDGIRERKEISQ